MAEILVPVARVSAVLRHPNADRLEIVQLEGLDWQVVGQRNTYHGGDPVVYVPPDAMLPEALSDELGVTKYLAKGRVRAVKLRGEPSFGFIFPYTMATPVSEALGADLSAQLGITKYEPPLKLAAGDQAPEHPCFPSYTDIENLRNYPAMFAADEAVQITEKIHGTNCRVGWVQGEWMAGSHRVRRKEPDCYRDNLYWSPLLLDAVQALISDRCSLGAQQVVLYGEVYGRVQKLHYGRPHDAAFVAFDLLVDGSYLNATLFHQLTQYFGVPTVPPLYSGPYGTASLARLANGLTTLGVEEHLREGLVVRPCVERTWVHPRHGFARAIGKYVGSDYLVGKIEDEAHD